MPPASGPVPYPPPTGGALNPYAPAPDRAPIHWALVLVGVPIGFVAWVVGSIIVLSVTSSADTSSTGVAVAVFVVLLLAAVGLIVWPRTRRLAQGFVLGLAIGLVVAGGLCIPLVSSTGF